MLLDILLLTGEEVPAHTDAYHAVVILDGMPLLATQYRVVDGFKLVFGIIQEPITRGGDAPVAKLIIYRQVAGTLIPIVIGTSWLLRHDIANVAGSPLALAHIDLISERDAPLVVLADDAAAHGVSLEGTIQADVEQLALERLDVEGISHTIPPLIVGVLIGLHQILLFLDGAPLIIHAHRAVGIDTKECQLTLQPRGIMIDAEEGTILIVGGKIRVALVHYPRDDNGGVLIEISYRWIVHAIDCLQLDGATLDRISEQESWTDITVRLLDVLILLLAPYALGTDAITPPQRKEESLALSNCTLANSTGRL